MKTQSLRPFQTIVFTMYFQDLTCHIPQSPTIEEQDTETTSTLTDNRWAMLKDCKVRAIDIVTLAEISGNKIHFQVKVTNLAAVWCITYE